MPTHAEFYALWARDKEIEGEEMKKPIQQRQPTQTFYLESLNPGEEGKILGESIERDEVERWKMQMQKMGVKCSEVKTGLLEDISERVREQKQRDWMRAE